MGMNGWSKTRPCRLTPWERDKKIVSTEGDPSTAQDKISRNCPQVSNKIITEGFNVNLSKWGNNDSNAATRFARISVRVDLNV